MIVLIGGFPCGFVACYFDFPVKGFSGVSQNRTSVTGVYSEFTRGGLTVGAGGTLVL